MQKTRVYKESANGKVIIVGEHASVYGHPALISTVGMQVDCEISDHGVIDTVLMHSLDELKKATSKLEIKLHQLQDFYQLASEKYASFLRENNKSYLDILGSDDWYAYAKLAVIQTYRELDLDLLAGLKVELRSSLPVGGFGSSTAVVVAIARALARYTKKKVSKKVLFKIAHTVETMLRGVSSGGDEATISFSGLISYQKGQPPTIRKITVPRASKGLLDCLIIDSGRPAYTTGEVVSWVADKRASDGNRVDRIFNDIAGHTQNLEKAIIAGDHALFRSIINEAGNLLENLGIINPKTQELISSLKKLSSGLAIKVSGAGTLQTDSSGGSGALLCFGSPEELSAASNFLSKANLNFYSTTLG